MLLWKEEKRKELVTYLGERDLLEDGPFWKLAQALLEVLPRDWRTGSWWAHCSPSGQACAPKGSARPSRTRSGGYSERSRIAMRSQDLLPEILGEYRRRLHEILGEELDSVIVYGSRARGDAVEESDIDVLCVLRSPFDYGDLIARTSEPAAELSLRYDVVISTAFATRKDLANRNTPFLMNVRREGWPYE
jgi:predicted nucleotidyltransferase